MASADATRDIVKCTRRSNVIEILSCRNTDLNVNVERKQKSKISSCSYLHKENINNRNCRIRSKSENCKSANFCTCGHLLQNPRIRTFSGNRSMHDKGMNVYMMPEKMPGLLLNGYKTKDEVKWRGNANGENLNSEFHSLELQSDKSTFKNSVSMVYENGRNCDSYPPNRIGGIKRSRDESPNVINGDTKDLKDGIPFKVQLRDMEEDVNISILLPSLRRDHDDKLSRESCDKLSTNCTGIPRNELVDKNNGCEDRDDDLEKLPPSIICVSSNVNTKQLNSTEVPNQNELTNFNSHVRHEITIISSDSSEGTEDEGQSTLHERRISNLNEILHPGLRQSLFPFVPPFIKFFPHDVKGQPFPPHVHKLLRWKLSTITPLVVRKVVFNSGFRLLKKSTYWGGTWGKHTKSVSFKTLFDYQKMNHFPGTFQIGRKDRLWRSMQKLMNKFGKSEFDLMPTTYILPRDRPILKVIWKKTEGKEPWIIKPPASARGTGIKVVHKWNQIPENSPLVVQKYISKPFLINDTKFDLRLYVLVTSVNPLRIYLYDNGLVRFASVKYSTELNTLSDRYMHLTNYSINKLSSKYKQNEDAHACQGHKWTLKALWNYMEKEMKIDVKKIWAKLIDLVIKTIISGEHSITQLSLANLVSRYNSYELFGIDVLFDKDLKPWLLEVNISPSLHSASPLDLAVKAPLVYNLLNIVGFHIPCSKKFTETELCEEMGNVPNNRLCYDNRLYTGSKTSGEKNKHHDFVSQAREEYLDNILEKLTPDDVRHLIQYEDELTQIGSFQKVFPSPTSHKYLNFLDIPRYYNFLFDAWETKYHKNRDDGVRLLRSMCQEGVHLCGAKVANNSKTYKTLPKYRQKPENNSSNEHTTSLLPNQLALKLKTAHLGKLRRRLRLSFVPSRTYPLRSRKPR